MKKLKGFMLLFVVGIMMLGMTMTVRADNNRSGEWEYSLHSGEATLEKYLGSSRNINIPLAIDEYPVTAIGGHIFEGSNITSVSIPYRIEEIGYYAFADCKYLTNIYFDAKNCANLNHHSFRNAGKFSEFLAVTFGPSVKRIPSALFYADENNYTHITDVVIPENVQVIGGDAFRNCFDLRNLLLKKGLIEIEGHAFENCMGLKSITIPETTEEIGEDAFSGLKYLTQINFNAVDCIVHHYSINVNYFDGAGKFSEALVLNVGNGVETIPPYLFSDTYVTSVFIPKSVKVLGIHSFVRCEALKNVTVEAPKVEYKDEMIGWYTPFGGCSSNIVFKCYRNSTTATYAKNNGFKISYIDSVVNISGCNVKLGATKYTYCGKENKPSVLLTYGSKKLTRDKDYTVTYKNNKYVGTASVIITGKGGFEGSVTKKFTIVPKGTVISKLSPVRKGFNVGIKKQTSQTTGYEVQYYINNKFMNPEKFYSTKNTATTLPIRNLSAGKKYYVRVRTYKTVSGKKYYSGWSPVKAVVTKK